MSQYIGNDPQGNLPVRNIYATNKNYLINPTFTINQRVFAGGALTDGQYAWDRWVAADGAANAALSGDTITITSGVIRQKLENFGYGGQVTLSWEGDSTVDIARIGIGTIHEAVSSPFTFDMYTTADGNEWNFKFYGAGTSFSKPKLEIGSTQTPFEYPTFADELNKCQRYFEKSYSYPTAIGAVTYTGCIYEGLTRNAGGATVGFRFTTAKRALPTVTLYSPVTGAAGKVDNSGDKTAVAQNTGWSSVRWVSVTGGTSAATANYHWTADAEI